MICWPCRILHTREDCAYPDSCTCQHRVPEPLPPVHVDDIVVTPRVVMGETARVAEFVLPLKLHEAARLYGNDDTYVTNAED